MTFDMSLSRATVGYIWVWAMVVFFGLMVWQEFPLVVANHHLGSRALTRLQLAVFLKPWNLLTWVILVVYGITATWKVRSNWHQDRGAMYVFVMCSFSVVWFILVLVTSR
jgi:hypothetical protein